MYSLRDLLGFVVGAAITAAIVVLLLPSSAPGCSCGHNEPALESNGIQKNLGIGSLNTVAAVSKEEDSLADQVCTFHANCLLGLQNKIDTLAGVLDEWKQFRAQQELLGNSTALTY